jgi:endoglucanase
MEKFFTITKLFLLSLAISALTCTAVFANDTLIVEKHGQLRVSGNKIVDKNGDPIALHGMCLYWSQWKGQFYNSSCVQWLRDDWKCTVVRAAMGINGTADGYLVNPAVEKAKIITIIDACINLGIYVIVDWHDHYAYQHRDQAIAFFEEIAALYGNTPNLIYEIFNEPVGSVSWTNSVKPYADSVVNHIRAIDPDNLILVGSPNWSQDVDVAANNPLLYSNIAYSFHFYAASHRLINTQYPNLSFKTKLQSALNKGVAVFVSEFGTTESSGTGVIDSNETNNWMKFMSDNKLSWCNWSVADLTEASAALKPGASADGGWLDSEISTSGLFIRRKLSEAYEGPATGIGTLSELPKNYELRQNYPNPFNPSTTISFSVGAFGYTSLRIYDLLGREVATLVNEKKPAGRYILEWNAQGVSTGVYYYRIQSGKFMETKKLMILK